jgi:DeoR/GlpR family transcriptional regulator of sugar metabolism
MNTADRERRMCFIINELLKLDPMRHEKMHQKYLSDVLDVDRRTVIRDIEVLLNTNLVKSVRGYQPTTKFVRFMIWVNERHPGAFKMDDSAM